MSRFWCPESQAVVRTRPSRVSRCGGSPTSPSGSRGWPTVRSWLAFASNPDGGRKFRRWWGHFWQRQVGRYTSDGRCYSCTLGCAGARCPRPARWRRTTAIVAVCGHCARRRCVCASFEAGRIGKGRRDASVLLATVPVSTAIGRAAWSARSGHRPYSDGRGCAPNQGRGRRAPRPEPGRVLFVGRLVEKKGVDVLTACTPRRTVVATHRRRRRPQAGGS